jgi:prepilin-type N-terminal cleavage/methylation domain-containing protein
MKKITRYSRGFTLIELLVVIAIIGILSSVVLVSLNTARAKGKDARIQGEVAQIRTSLESEFTGSKYPTLGSTADGSSVAAYSQTVNSNIKTLALDIESLSGAGAGNVLIYSTSTQAGYSINATNSSGVKICYDSFGTASTSYTGTASKVDCTK